MTEDKRASLNAEPAKPIPQIRVAIVDDHAMVRQGLRAFLQLANDIEIVAESATGAEAIQLAESEDIDVMLMDLVMPGDHDGISATREITSKRDKPRIIALTSFQEPDRMLGAIEAGAISYLQKDVSPDDLLFAIRQAALGRTVLEPEALLALRGASKRDGKPSHDVFTAAPEPSNRSTGMVEPFTEREREVLDALAQGMSNKEIASALGITEKTVKVHVSHILAKLGVYDRTQAILAASRLGYIHI